MKTLRLLFLCIVLPLGACASVSTQVVKLDPALQLAPSPRVEVLLEKPARAHLAIALLESRGTSEAQMLNDAREKAAALGADAIVKLDTERIHHEPVLMHDPWFGPYHYGFGYAPFSSFAMRPHPWTGYRMAGGGYSYVLKALAIKYRDAE